MNKKDLEFKGYVMITFVFLFLGTFLAAFIFDVTERVVEQMTIGELYIITFMSFLFCLGLAMWSSTKIPETGGD